MSGTLKRWEALKAFDEGKEVLYFYSGCWWSCNAPSCDNDVWPDMPYRLETDDDEENHELL